MDCCLDDQTSGSMRLSSSSAQPPLLSTPATWLLEKAFKGLTISVQPSIIAVGSSSELAGEGRACCPYNVPITWSVPKGRYLLSGLSRDPRVIHDHICINLRCCASSRVIVAPPPPVTVHVPCPRRTRGPGECPRMIFFLRKKPQRG